MSLRTKRLEMELGGKVRPLLFDNSFLDILTETQTLSEIGQLEVQKPWRFVPTLALAALRAGVEFEGGKDKFDLKTVSGWTEQVEDPMELFKVVDAYRQAMGFTYQSAYGRDILAEAEEKLKEQSL